MVDQQKMSSSNIIPEQDWSWPCFDKELAYDLQRAFPPLIILQYSQ